MRTPCTLILLVLSLHAFTQQKKQVLFFQTDWGRNVSWDTFCERTKTSGYDGVETWYPNSEKDQKELKAALEKYDLKVAFLNGTDKSLPFDKSLKTYTENFAKLLAWQPAYINCHTGSDFFTFEQNRAFIDAANKIATQSGIPIYHETHRGRFSFNLPVTNTFLERIPDLQLNLDISHWMVVHESLLQNQDTDLEEVIDRTHHIHARVGHAEGPQVNDPSAPEWEKTVKRHLDIWEKVIRQKWKTDPVFTATTEFGPPDYMPTLPYTRKPVADQWQANTYIMQKLKERLTLD